jgi:hypothetical protein
VNHSHGSASSGSIGPGSRGAIKFYNGRHGIAEQHINLTEVWTRIAMKTKFISETMQLGEQIAMVETVKFHWRLTKLKRAKREDEKSYNKLIAETRKNNKPRDEIDSLMHDAQLEERVADDQIREMVSRRLLDIADEYLLPRPEFKMKDGAWEESDVTSRWRLKPEAILELRAAIRKERKDRSEHMLMWAPALIGLLGAISGLVAVIKAG